MKLLFSFILSFNFLSAQTWSQLPDFTGTERDDGVAAVINNKAYVGTGLKNGTGIGNDFCRLDLSTNTWTTISSMPVNTNRQYAAAFTYSNYLFVSGGLGNAGAVFNDTYRYDVTTDTWTAVVSKPGSAVWGASSFTLNNKAYLTGGKFTNGAVSNEVWEYDMITNVWTQKNNFVFGGRWRASAAVLNSVAYLIFGLDNNGTGSYRKEIYKYNPSGDSWSKIADFPQAKGRAYTAMQALQNKLVIFGGHDTSGTYFNDCWFFDETNGFVQGPAMPSFARKGGMSFSQGNKFYYTCGINVSNTRLKETWLLELPVGIAENSTSKDFFLYPNPCRDIITILNNRHLEFKIELYNLIGEKISLNELTDNLILNLSSLPKGIYFLKIVQQDSKVEFKKIIKE